MASPVRIAKSPVKRLIYKALGFLFLGLAFPAIVIPFVPAFDMVLLSAFFFAMSSEKWYDWVLRHPKLGPMIRDYRAGLGISVRAKLWAVTAIAATFAATIGFAVERWQVAVVMVATAGGIITFVVTRPTKSSRRRVGEPGQAAAGSGRHTLHGR